MDRDEMRATATALMIEGSAIVDAAMETTSERGRNDLIAIAANWFMCAMGMEALALRAMERELDDGK